MLRFDDIRSHEIPRHTLQAAIQRQKVAHAYLFAGPPGVGKRKVAEALFGALLCERGGTQACFECAACKRYEAGVHQDYRVMEADGRFIKIEQVRDLSRLVHYPPIEGRFKCILIVDAENLHESAANALLKKLEEPSSSTVFVLLTTRAHLLLPTIVSRCQQVRFAALDRATVASLLMEKKQVASEVAHTVAAMSDGNMERAFVLLDSDLLAYRTEWMDRLVKLPTASVSDMLLWAELATAEKDRWEPVVELLRLFVRDVMLVAAGIPPDQLTYREFLPQLIEWSRKISVHSAINLLDLILGAYRVTQFNANPKLMMEHLFLQISACFSDDV